MGLFLFLRGIIKYYRVKNVSNKEFVKLVVPSNFQEIIISIGAVSKYLALLESKVCDKRPIIPRILHENLGLDLWSA